MFSTVEFGGAEPTDNRVSDNTVRDNEPADIVYDGSGSGNEFDDNRCDTSQPEDLCD